MNLSEFRKTAQFIPNYAAKGLEEYSTPALVYARGLAIILNPNRPGKTFSLQVNMDVMNSNDLSYLERILYEWAGKNIENF